MNFMMPTGLCKVCLWYSGSTTDFDQVSFSCTSCSSFVPPSLFT